MKKIRITIERSSDLFNAYAENLEGIYGVGETVAECKRSILDAIDLTIKYNADLIPEMLKGEYQLIFKFDSISFFNYYKGIFTNAALERMTGINQRLLYQYSTGIKSPGPRQLKKVEAAMHKLGTELTSIEL